MCMHAQSLIYTYSVYTYYHSLLWKYLWQTTDDRGTCKQCEQVCTVDELYTICAYALLCVIT